MGTVGLSFGSPTSGAGFDVSSTVAEIVGNLKNVETPWKTQLTNLQGQDTAISSLGTLYSNLSNDMSAMTDFQGVMALKEGSVSDQSVMQITAADATAKAGTYTVQVQNLAQTSSGYLAQVSSATQKLTGSITLQAGTGTALTLSPTSPDNTLAGLASTINAAGIGINANVITESSGAILSLVSTTSGQNGNITVSNNTIAAANSALGYTGAAGSGTTASNGTLTPITNASDALTGSISIGVGSGTAENVVIGAAPTNPADNTIYTGSGVNTLAGIALAINNTSSIGVTASVVKNSDGSSSLSLKSNTTGTAGTLNVTSSIVDTSNSLGYTTAVTGADASFTVNGISVTSSSNTVSNAISGVTFQLLAPSPTESDNSLEQVQVVIANDNNGVESTMAQFVSDYNALISGINAQEGNDSSGNPEPLFGSPTLSLLQQQLLSGLNSANPNGYLTAISDNTDTTLSGSMNITVGSGTPVTVTVGSGTNTATHIYTGSGSGYNTLSGLAAAINAAGDGSTLAYSGTNGTSSANSTGTLASITSAGDLLAGSISIQVGNGATENIVIGAAPTSPAANTIYTGSGINTLAGLAAAIQSAGIGVSANVTTASNGVTTLALTSNTAGSAGTLTVDSNVFAAGLGFTANVVTQNGQSSLVLASQTEGSTGGGLGVTSNITATSDTLLNSTVTAGSSTVNSSASLSAISSGSDHLSGSIAIQVGDNAVQTISVPSTSPNNTLYGLANAITAANIGVSASVVTNSNGSYLSLVSGTSGSDGDLTVTSSVLDTTATNQATLSYTNSSDINSLTTLGISVNNDGSLVFDAASLDSVMNSDFSSVSGFFQNANSWGQAFNTMLTNSGSSATTGVLALATKSNSNIESTLNADVSKEEALISAEQSSLTTELNNANQVMQSLPSQLQGVNELYSAITGYNQQTNG
jgi:flagellar hook-associated protein 2